MLVATIIQGVSTRPTDVTDSIYITIHIDLRNNLLDRTSHAFGLFAWTLFLVNRMFPVTCFVTFGRKFGGEKNTLNQSFSRLSSRVEVVSSFQIVRRVSLSVHVLQLSLNSVEFLHLFFNLSPQVKTLEVQSCSCKLADSPTNNSVDCRLQTT